jgi:hypothetical protein
MQSNFQALELLFVSICIKDERNDDADVDERRNLWIFQ